jgi:hypothetical protein
MLSLRRITGAGWDLNCNTIIHNFNTLLHDVKNNVVVKAELLSGNINYFNCL